MNLKHLATVTSTLIGILIHESIAAEEHRHFKIFNRNLQNSVTTEQDICLEPAATERLTIPPIPPTIKVKAAEVEDGAELIKKGKNLNELRTDKLKNIKKEDFVFDMNTKLITGYYDHNKFFSVIGEDGRKKVAYPKTISHPWSTMCHIEAAFPGFGIAQGSGVLIGNQFVLTAGHVVWQQAFGGNADRIVVTPALDASSPPNDLPYGQYDGYQFKSTNLWTEEEDLDWDFAVIKLDREVTDAYGNTPGSLGIAALFESDLDRQWINVTGYPGDKGIADPHDPLHPHSWGRTMWTAGGTITGMHADNLEFEIDINHGNSGGPIWGEWQGYYHIFGIATLDHHGPNPIHWHYHSGVRITNFKLNLINGMINGPW